jgi:sn-glycerol 3-phosphate transport system substrate-binding protein
MTTGRRTARTTWAPRSRRATQASRRARGARRTRRVGTAVLAAALVAAACSEPPTGVTGSATAECPIEALHQADGPTEVTLWYGGIGGPTEAVLRDQVDRFNEAQDDVHLTAANQGRSFQEVYRKYQTTAAASTAQLPDIVMVEDTSLQSMVDGGNVLPAQACMEADDFDIDQIAPVVRANYTVDGQLYPGYAHLSTPILYYNKAHFARAGLDPNDPPDTLEEVHDAARTLKEQGVSERPLSFKVSWSFFKTWMTAAGVDLVNNENGRDGLATEAEFDTPEMRDVLDLLQRMEDEDLLNAFANIEGGVDQYIALASQQSSMLIETSTASSSIASFLQGSLDAEAAGEGFDPDAVDLNQLVPGSGPFPGVDAGGQVQPGGGVYYILDTSTPAQQAGSWRFLRFMLEQGNSAQWFTEGGYLPMVTDIDGDESVRSFLREDMAGLLLSPALEQLQEASPDDPAPMIGPFQDFTDGLEDAIDGVLFEGADAGPALRSAQEDVTESLGRYAG